MTPNVLLYAASGAVLGLVLGMWTQAGLPATIASVIVLAILSGIFGMFVDLAPLVSWCRLAVNPRRTHLEASIAEGKKKDATAATGHAEEALTHLEAA